MAIAGLQGNEMAQPRVFAHDAKSVSLNVTITGTETRGVCLYVGDAAGGTGKDITVIMESGSQATFYAVPAGSFLPILVTKVVAFTGDITKVLALYQMLLGIKLTVPSLRKIFGDITPPVTDDLIELENNSFAIQLEANTGTDAIKIE